MQAGLLPPLMCLGLTSSLLLAPLSARAGESKPGHPEHTLPSPPQPPRIKGPCGFSLHSCSNKGSSVPRHGRHADGANWVSAKGLGGSAAPTSPLGALLQPGLPPAPCTEARDVIRAGGRWEICLSSHCLPVPCLSLHGQGGSVPWHGSPQCPLCRSPGLHWPPSWEMRAQHECGEQT